MANEAEIHKMAQSEDVEERKKALYEYRNFVYFIDKEQVTKNLMELIKDKDSNVQRHAVITLGSAFAYLTDKKQAWKDLMELTKDKDKYVRLEAARTLSPAFVHVTDKEQAAKDMMELTKNKDSNVRLETVRALSPAFFIHITDKNQAWKDLMELRKDKDRNVREDAAEALGSAFAYVTDKDMATKDLLALTKDEDSGVQWRAAEALGSAFAHLTDKNQAWEDLIALAKDENYYVRENAAKALGSAFAYATDKDKATKDLLALTKNENSYVRLRAAEVLGSAFAHLTDKNQAWKDLLALAKDEDNCVRAYANHSLGRVYIFKATEAEAEENFRKEFEKALEFFEKSSKETILGLLPHPAEFCHPFYRSFYTIIFKKEDAEAEVQKYLNEAKNAVEGSESKENLLEAVENLSNALKEAQQAQNFNEMKHDLNAYRRYCDRAVELLDSTEDKTPGPAKVIRRGLPVIDERIKQILAEIQEKAKTLYKQTQGTQFADLGDELNKAGQNFLKIRNPIALDKAIGNMQIVLSSICAKMPEDEKGEACELLKQARDEPYVEDRINLTNMVLSKISSNIGRNVIYTKEFNMVKKIQVTGGPGITAVGDVNIHDINAPLAIGENIVQTQTLSALDKKELLGSLLGFQKEVAKLGLPADEMSTVNGDITAAIKEAKKEEPDVSKIKSRFKSTVDTIKEVGDSIEKVSKWEWTGKILKILGKFGFSILL